MKNPEAHRVVIKETVFDVFYEEEEYLADSEDILATDWEKYVQRETT